MKTCFSEGKLNFLMTPLFVQILKTRTPPPPPLILGGGGRKLCSHFSCQVKRALLLDFVLQRKTKNILCYKRDLENCTDQASIFYYLINSNIHTESSGL